MRANHIDMRNKYMYGNMHLIYVDIHLIYVDIQLSYADMKPSYVDMRNKYVDTQLCDILSELGKSTCILFT